MVGCGRESGESVEEERKRELGKTLRGHGERDIGWR